jgi:hypothetical protein
MCKTEMLSVKLSHTRLVIFLATGRSKLIRLDKYVFITRIRIWQIDPLLELWYRFIALWADLLLVSRRLQPPTRLMRRV